MWLCWGQRFLTTSWGHALKAYISGSQAQLEVWGANFETSIAALLLLIQSILWLFGNFGQCWNDRAQHDPCRKNENNPDGFTFGDVALQICTSLVAPRRSERPCLQAKAHSRFCCPPVPCLFRSGLGWWNIYVYGWIWVFMWFTLEPYSYVPSMLKRCLPKLLRLDRLGDGGESAKSAIATAKAVVAETGDEHVHKVTKRVASFKNNGNSNRDLFRFIRLPLDISWVTCPVFEKPGSDKVVDGLLPMYDPHELLQYLWTTGRMKATPATIETVGFQSLYNGFLFSHLCLDICWFEDPSNEKSTLFEPYDLYY